MLILNIKTVRSIEVLVTPNSNLFNSPFNGYSPVFVVVVVFMMNAKAIKIETIDKTGRL